MFALEKTEKKGDTYQSIQIEKEKAKDFISSITADDIRKERYIFFEKDVEFFKKNYKPLFFRVDEEGYIFLKVLPNGIRRTKKYTKRIDYKKTFHNTMQRIEEKLEKALSHENMEIKTIYFSSFSSSQMREIFIIIEDLLENPRIQKTVNRCYIVFDIEKFTFSIVFIEGKRSDAFYPIIRRVFKKETLPTKNYRRKKCKSN